MQENFFNFLTQIDTFFWGYCAFTLILILGSYFTFQNKFFQVREIGNIGFSFFKLYKTKKSNERGVDPLRAFFASTGGMIGIGNVVGIVTAVQFGGPGALFWVWIAGMIGSVIKYAEIFLGVKYRIANGKGGFDGGPMYFLKAAFGSHILPIISAVLLCIYGVEIYQFSVITETLNHNFGIHRLMIIGVMLALVLYVSLGGVRRLGKIASYLLPIFLCIYIFMAFFVIFSEIHAIPALIATIFKSAFTGHAAVGGFAGASTILAIQHGLSRAAYSADIGIGYDSIIQSESNVKKPEQQARLAIFGVFIDNIICTLSILVALLSGLWSADIPGSQLVQTALSKYFPFANIFMPLFLTILGFTTITAFFCVGIKCAKFLFPKAGERLYILYGCFAFILFAYIDQSVALVVMSISGALLLIINLLAMWRLRREVFVSEINIVNTIK